MQTRSLLLALLLFGATSASPPTAVAHRPDHPPRILVWGSPAIRFVSRRLVRDLNDALESIASRRRLFVIAQRWVDETPVSDMPAETQDEALRDISELAKLMRADLAVLVSVVDSTAGWTIGGDLVRSGPPPRRWSKVSIAPAASYQDAVLRFSRAVLDTAGIPHH